MKINILYASLAAFFAASAVSATALPAEATGVNFSAFNIASQGALLASEVVDGAAFTFTGEFRAAVYRNTAGTLDFYYQVQRTGAGEVSSDDIQTITAANFQGYTVDALYSDSDVDGTGIFTAADNDALQGTASRNSGGKVIAINLGSTAAALSDTQTSSTYVFRTNASEFNTLGTFGVSDGSTFPGRTYQPTALAAVPEPASWAMMVGGFGLLGGALRRKRTFTELSGAI